MIDDRNNKLMQNCALLEGDDLISKLPDEVLTHVLAFVCTRRAVSTSVLSKRWKLLWTLVPNLEFYFYHSSSSLRTRDEQRVLFENFVNRVLTLNKVASVRRVILSCPQQTHVSRANAWARALVMRNAEEFHLELPYSCPPFEYISFNMFPDVFFNQKNLIKLYLGNVAVKVPPVVCFPCLKTITLCNVQFLDDDSSGYLVSGCPVLTDLFIQPVKVSRRLVYLCDCFRNKIRCAALRR